MDLKARYEAPHVYSTSYSGEIELFDNGSTFYVDGQGILRRPRLKPPSSKQKTRKTQTFVSLPSAFLARDSDGVWYYVRTAPPVKKVVTVNDRPQTQWDRPGAIDLPFTFTRPAGWYFQEAHYPVAYHRLSSSERKYYKVDR